MTNPETRQQTLPDGRTAGVGLHLSSLPGDFGIGELGQDAFRFVDLMVDLKLSVWQFLPLGPTAYGDSPYQPLSTFAGNEMLIDIGELIRLGLLDSSEVAELTHLPRSSVAFGNLIPMKTRLLQLAAGRFHVCAPKSLQNAFDEFVARHDQNWLHDYALFRLLKSRHGERPWPEWDEPFRHRDEPALAALSDRSRLELQSRKILQFLFFHQWQALKTYANGRGIRLFGDLPIYIALDSADAWSNRHILSVDSDGQPDFVAGVPPDYFSADGQLWGNPLYDWQQHAATGFDWWVQRLAACRAQQDLVRIDHFRGFESYWAIPADADTARNGSWLPGPGDALFDAMRAALGHVPIVAEDLGIITDEVTALRTRQSIPGMRVLQFDVADPGFELDQVPADTVCYTGTHDNDTTLGWFTGSPSDLRTAEDIAKQRDDALRVTHGTPETIHCDFVRAAFSTAAGLAIAPLQDYLGLGSGSRMNTPGTTGGNWRWRFAWSQTGAKMLQTVAELVMNADRAPHN